MSLHQGAVQKSAEKGFLPCVCVCGKGSNRCNFSRFSIFIGPSFLESCFGKDTVAHPPLRILPLAHFLSASPQTKDESSLSQPLAPFLSASVACSPSWTIPHPIVNILELKNKIWN